MPALSFIARVRKSPFFPLFTYIAYKIADHEDSPVPLSLRPPLTVNTRVRLAIERGDFEKVKYYVDNNEKSKGIMPNYFHDDPRTPSCVAADSYAQCVKNNENDCERYIPIIKFLANNDSRCYPKGDTSTIHSLAAIPTEQAAETLEHILANIIPKYTYIYWFDKRHGDPIHHYIKESTIPGVKDGIRQPVTLLDVAENNPYILPMLQRFLAIPPTCEKVQLTPEQIKEERAEIDSAFSEMVARYEM